MKKLLLIIAVSLFTQFTIFGQSPSVGVQYVVPTGTAADLFDSGYGVTGATNYSILPLLLDLKIEGSWRFLKGKEIFVDENLNVKNGEDFNIYGITVGPVLTLGILDAGVKAGYFFGDVSEWDVVPFAQVNFLMLSVGAEYKAIGDINWTAVYLNLNF